MICGVLMLVAGIGTSFEIPLTRTQRAQKLVEEGQWQILRGNFLQAIDSCTQALGIRADWAPAYLCRSEARMLVQDRQADKDAWKAAHLDPQSGAPFRVLGIMEYDKGQYLKAIMHFDQALVHTKLRPEDVSDVYYYRAQSKLHLGSLEASLKDVDRGLGIMQGLNGDYANWTFNSLRAEIYRRLGQQVKADEDEKRVLKLINERMRRRPQEKLDLLPKRAEAYSLLRNYDAAANDYGEILSRDQENMKILMDRAYALSMAGKQEDAILDLDRVLDLNPKNLSALRMRALARISLGDHAGAISDLNEYLSLKPQDGSALAHRGISKRFIEDYQGSLQDLNRAQALHPEDERSLWGHKAFVQEMLGEHKSALKSADKALEEDPEDFSAHMARAQAGVVLGDCARVQNSLEWLVQKFPKSGYYLWLRGECRSNEGDYAKGLEDLENAAALEPQSDILAQRLAYHHRSYLDQFPLRVTLDELRKSQKYFDRAKSLGVLPNDQRIDRARTLFEIAGRLLDNGASQEGRRLMREADSECDFVLKRDPHNALARELRGLIRKR